MALSLERPGTVTMQVPPDVAGWLAEQDGGAVQDELVATLRERMARERNESGREWTHEELAAGCQLLADTPEYQDIVFPVRGNFEAWALLDEDLLRPEDFDQDLSKESTKS